MLEKPPEISLDCQTKPVNPKEYQPWIFIGRIDAKAPIFWPPDVKSWLLGKDPDAGKDWRQKEKGWKRMRWVDSIIDSMDMNLSKLWAIVKDREAWLAAVHRVAKSRRWLSNWTTVIQCNFIWTQNNKILPLKTTWMDLEDNTLSEIKPDKDEYQLPYDLSYLKSANLLKKWKQTHLHIQKTDWWLPVEGQGVWRLEVNCMVTNGN